MQIVKNNACSYEMSVLKRTTTLDQMLYDIFRTLIGSDSINVNNYDIIHVGDSNEFHTITIVHNHTYQKYSYERIFRLRQSTKMRLVYTANDKEEYKDHLILYDDYKDKTIGSFVDFYNKIITERKKDLIKMCRERGINIFPFKKKKTLQKILLDHYYNVQIFFSNINL